MLCLAILILFLQWQSGAYQAEHTGFSDEPGHFVTGLMVYDFLLSGEYGDPYKFAENFYLHYPMVAIGHWPPGYYALQAVWYLLFGVSRSSPLLLNAALTLVTASLLWVFARNRYNLWAATAIATGYVLVAMVQDVTNAVMAEPLMVAAGLGAVMAFSVYLDSGRSRWLWLCATLTAFTVLAKTLGWVIALVPIATALFARRWSLLRRPVFWAAMGSAFVVGGAWEIFAANPVVSGYEQHDGLTDLGVALSRFGRELSLLADQLSWPVVVMAALGGAVVLSRSLRRKDASALTPHCFVVAGTLAMIWYSPIPVNTRYLTLAAPSALLLAAEGCRVLGSMAPPARRRWASAGVAALLVVGFCVSALELRKKAIRGYAAPIEAALGAQGRANEVILVASLADAEPILVSEFALREHQPKRIVLRAAKLLADTPWTVGNPYKPFIRTAQEANDYLLKPPVGLVLFHDDLPYAWFEHHDLLHQAIEQRPHLWASLGKFPVRSRSNQKGEASISLYRLRDFEERPRRPIYLHMVSRLGHDICEGGDCRDGGTD